MLTSEKRSWSRNTYHEEVWLRCKGNCKNQRSKSVTNKDVDELKACIELGFRFDSSPIDDNRRLSDTLPTLDLYYAVKKRYNDIVLLRLQQHSLPPRQSPLLRLHHW
ncbi:hypothetical protein Fmac_027274 [Flemingia macrophylla]|uniref:Uncharacterized protein n=1 Tax=Flemingia macrophylla TaxID=520843 RepID=A0ABD1LIX2_9FABA